MGSISYLDKTTGEYVKMGSPKVDAYSKEQTDALIAAIPKGVEMELLWENASPSSDFAAQTINLDLSNYQGVLIGFKMWGETDSIIRSFCFVGEKARLVFPDSHGEWSAELHNVGRDVTIQNNAIIFADGYTQRAKDSLVTATNEAITPVNIYGVKGVKENV